MFEVNSIIHGDCLEVLRTFPDDCIDLTVTSPPYDNLRHYNGYTFDFEGIAQQLFRVTKQGGVVVWVVGDATVNGSETGTSFRQALYFMECGFSLHDTMIYQKPGMRYPDNLRYNAVFEYMFIFSKGKPKTFNAIKDRINIYAGGKISRLNQVRQPNGEMGPNSAYRNDPDRRISDVGCRDNVWRISSGRENAVGKKHPASFPEKLANDHIISWSNKGDIVLDIFCGSGTTCKMAIENHRKYIGIEISEEYCKIARQRITQAQPQLF